MVSPYTVEQDRLKQQDHNHTLVWFSIVRMFLFCITKHL